jgi:hypothetical protein
LRGTSRFSSGGRGGVAAGSTISTSRCELLCTPADGASTMRANWSRTLRSTRVTVATGSPAGLDLGRQVGPLPEHLQPLLHQTKPALALRL